MTDESGYNDENDGELREHTATCFLIDQLYIRRLIGSSHHFHGVQMITMRKVFLDPVRAKIGMLVVHSDEGARPREIPMRDTDYLRILKRIKSLAHKRIIMTVCDEEADPLSCYRLGSSYELQAAFDALVEADEEHMRARESEMENK